jgi:hypothetical protein
MDNTITIWVPMVMAISSEYIDDPEPIGTILYVLMYMKNSRHAFGLFHYFDFESLSFGQ